MRLPEPKRSNFNLGRVNRFSASPGYVIPCYVEEILPNSHKRLDVEALIQTNATIAPLMGSFKARFDAFFVPLRLYHRHLDLNNVRPDFDDNFDYHYIKIPTKSNVVLHQDIIGNDESSSQLVLNLGLDSYHTPSWRFAQDGSVTDRYDTALSVSPSSLIDYLGLLPVGFNHLFFSGDKKLNAEPFIAYYDIWRNFYSNPHDRYVPFRCQNSTYLPVDGESFNADFIQYNLYDSFIPITALDNFINFINSQSLVGDGLIQSVDVINAFYMTMLPKLVHDTISTRIRPYLVPPLFSGQLSGIMTNEVTATYRSFDTRDGIHFGLLPKTYNDDYFNSRFLNSFVTYMEESARVTVENNEFTIQQLRLQNRIAKYVDKSIFSDTRFGSWIKAHFGVKTSAKLNIPQFLGSISTNVIFNDIYASAQTGDGDITSNQALGSRASLGQGYLSNKGSFIEFKATEPGYLMVMFSLTPYVSYFQGIKKMYLKSSFQDMYKPEFDAVGYQDLQKLELFAVGQQINPYYPYLPDEDGPSPFDAPYDINEYNVSIGKQPSYIEYMTSYDESHGLFAKKYSYGAWVLNRPYSSNNYDERVSYLGSYNGYDDIPVYSNPNFDATTYIRPEEFNSIFSVDKFIDNFQVQARFYDKTKQPMGKQILPHL